MHQPHDVCVLELPAGNRGVFMHAWCWAAPRGPPPQQNLQPSCTVVQVDACHEQAHGVPSLVYVRTYHVVQGVIAGRHHPAGIHLGIVQLVLDGVQGEVVVAEDAVPVGGWVQVGG